MTLKEYRSLLRKNRVCLWCRSQDARTLAGGQLCEACAKKRKEYTRSYYWKNREKIKEYQRQLYRKKKGEVTEQ